MSYTITVNGHLDDPSQEEAIIESAKEFVAGLDGVAAGNFSGTTGSYGLMPEPSPGEVGAAEENDPATPPADMAKISQQPGGSPETTDDETATD